MLGCRAVTLVAALWVCIDGLAGLTGTTCFQQAHVSCDLFFFFFFASGSVVYGFIVLEVGETVSTVREREGRLIDSDCGTIQCISWCVRI